MLTVLFAEVANAWPPCLRVIVKETALENLSVGSLFIVTCTGGTLGREGDHAIFIPDINISKVILILRLSHPGVKTIYYVFRFTLCPDFR